MPLILSDKKMLGLELMEAFSHGALVDSVMFCCILIKVFLIINVFF